MEVGLYSSYWQAYLYLRGIRYTFSLCVNVSNYDCSMSDLTRGNVFCPPLLVTLTVCGDLASL